jgi:hypothetical protein
MLIDIANEFVQGLISFFTKYRETSFAKALEVANDIAMEMVINLGYRTKSKITRKRQLEEGPANAPTHQI